MKQERTKDTSVSLGCPNHELSGDFVNWPYPTRTVPWGASCVVL